MLHTGEEDEDVVEDAGIVAAEEIQVGADPAEMIMVVDTSMGEILVADLLLLVSTRRQ